MAAGETRDLILNVAETMFADRGFHGVSVREIADAAGVRQSLVHYHFLNKETLYVAVYERRVLPINHLRLNQVRDVMEKAGSAPPALSDLLHAFLGPSVLASRKKTTGGDIYAKLMAQLINDPQEHALRIGRAYNDPMAQQILEMLRQTLPQANGAALTWGYIFAIGAMATAMATTGRAKRLNPDCDLNDVDQTLGYLTTFVQGGLEAIARNTSAKANVRRAPRKARTRSTA